MDGWSGGQKESEVAWLALHVFVVAAVASCPSRAPPTASAAPWLISRKQPMALSRSQKKTPAPAVAFGTVWLYKTSAGLAAKLQHNGFGHPQANPCASGLFHTWPPWPMHGPWPMASETREPSVASRSREPLMASETREPPGFAEAQSVDQHSDCHRRIHASLPNASTRSAPASTRAEGQPPHSVPIRRVLSGCYLPDSRTHPTCCAPRPGPF